METDGTSSHYSVMVLRAPPQSSHHSVAPQSLAFACIDRFFNIFTKFCRASLSLRGCRRTTYSHFFVADRARTVSVGAGRRLFGGNNGILRPVRWSPGLPTCRFSADQNPLGATAAYSFRYGKRRRCRGEPWNAPKIVRNTGVFRFGVGPPHFGAQGLSVVAVAQYLIPSICRFRPLRGAVIWKVLTLTLDDESTLASRRKPVSYFPCDPACNHARHILRLPSATRCPELDNIIRNVE